VWNMTAFAGLQAEPQLDVPPQHREPARQGVRPRRADPDLRRSFSAAYVPAAARSTRSNPGTRWPSMSRVLPEQVLGRTFTAGG
jgi:hypothetical protein